MKDKWINVGHDGDELKPHTEPVEDFNDTGRIGKKHACLVSVVYLWSQKILTTKWSTGNWWMTVIFSERYLGTNRKSLCQSSGLFYHSKFSFHECPSGLQMKATWCSRQVLLPLSSWQVWNSGPVHGSIAKGSHDGQTFHNATEPTTCVFPASLVTLCKLWNCCL